MILPYSCLRFLWSSIHPTGQEPYYMINNYDYFFFNSLQECCEKFYPWDIYKCTGTSPTLTNGQYYPDWSGDNSNTCLYNGETPVPEYMLINQNYYLSTTLEKCCKKHFVWNINKCLGNSGASEVGTNDWYVDWNWSDTVCVQNKGSNLADSWDQLYNSKEECCKKGLFWIDKRKCLAQ